MADLKKLADDATTRAVVEVGKQAAKKALDDILPPDEDEKENGTDKDGEPKAKSSRKWWIIAGVVLAVCAVIGVVGLVMAYWQWFLLAGILGLGALYGYYRLRQNSRAKKKKAKDESSKETSEEVAPKKTRVAAKPAPEPEADDKSAEEAAALAAARRREALEERRRQLEVEREARAEREREIDDELAAMKERIKREG